MSGSTASAYDNANKPTVALQNPLAAFGQYVGVQNALNETKLFQARQAAGQAYQQATDPLTGQVDPMRAQALIAANPQAALAAQGSATSGQALAQAQQGFNVQQQQRITGQLGSLLSQGDEQQTRANYEAMARQELTAGTINQQHFDNAMVNMPPAGSPPSAFRNFGTRALVGTLAGPEMASVLLPTTGTTTGQDGKLTGYTRQPVLPAQGAGAVSSPPQAGAPQGLTAAERAELVEVTDNNPSSPTYGQKFKVRRDSLSGAAGPEPANTSPLGTGRLPPALLKPPAATPAAAPQPPPGQLPGGASPSVPAGASPAGLAPGSPEEMQGSAQHAVVARDRANGYQQRIQPVEGALTALAGADTGRASEVLNNLRANVQDITPAFLQKMLPGAITDPAKRVAFEEANKYLTSIAINAPGGARSDAGQAAAGAASPSVHISNAAATQVARAILAQQRLEQAGTLAFNKSGQPAQNYDRFMNTWNTTADPRAFIADKMSKSERADLVKSLGGVGSAAYQKFKQSYQDGVDTGVVAGHGG